VSESGRYDVRIAWLPHENRAKTARVKLTVKGKSQETTVNMTEPAGLDNGFHSIGLIDVSAGTKGAVELFTKGAQGNVHADAVQLVPIK
jgi:hypothetical protein